MTLQVPTLPEKLQTLQPPTQPLLQQTPSTHWPLWHSLAFVQAVPLTALGWQAPLVSQKCVDTQSPSTLHPEGQAPLTPSQT
jgi:hypothetical protein